MVGLDVDWLNDLIDLNDVLINELLILDLLIH